jgi:hypothetical protein
LHHPGSEGIKGPPVRILDHQQRQLAMTDTAVHDLPLAQAAALIRTRKLSPVAYTRALLERTDALEPQLSAYITRTSEAAMEAARAAEAEISRRNYRGPLHGVPFAVKDIYDTAGILTSGHSRTCLDRVPSRDATAVAKLRAAGAVLMGKLATHEFAHGGPSFDLPWPPARNPWNTAHFTGGSSSGSGAAIAAGLMPVSLGSDTGGSIRGPAGLCGIAGLKPTYGLVRRPMPAPGAKAGAIDPKPWVPDTTAIEPAVRAWAENAAVHAGLRLPGHIMEELVAVAPWALVMARGLKRDHPREAETASIFDPGRDVD